MAAPAVPTFTASDAVKSRLEATRGSKSPQQAEAEWAVSRAGALLARTAVVDMAAFFVVLLVGFAYVWSRGDLDWVRAVSAERAAAG